MKKLIFRLTILLSALMLFPFQAVEACTGFIVGKNLTADGSTLKFIQPRTIKREKS